MYPLVNWIAYWSTSRSARIILPWREDFVLLVRGYSWRYLLREQRAASIAAAARDVSREKEYRSVLNSDIPTRSSSSLKLIARAYRQSRGHFASLTFIRRIYFARFNVSRKLRFVSHPGRMAAYAWNLNWLAMTRSNVCSRVQTEIGDSQRTLSASRFYRVFLLSIGNTRSQILLRCDVTRSRVFALKLNRSFRYEIILRDFIIFMLFPCMLKVNDTRSQTSGMSKGFQLVTFLVFRCSFLRFPRVFMLRLSVLNPLI